ncbi:AsmA family protein [Oleomonas cavernae]|uniref:AsmA family protein n=1 Tax=Oleomonas cavernae TaxID=2320859 RepID=A0A418WDW1_9PROT|nr:AsmA family protein [Oleomonas cavernae]RJF88178.1 AsmA family protein [Oleomonas cavernae]
MRKLLIGVGLFVGLVVGLGFAAPLLVDLNDQKPRIVALIEEATGHKVTLGGDIQFSLLPAPAMSVRDIRVDGTGTDAATLATVDALDLRLSLLPLLGGNIEVAEVRLSRPTVVITDQPGPGRPDAAPPATGAAPPATAPAAIAVQRVVIEEGTVEYRPAGAPPVKIEAIEASLSAPTFAGPFTATGGASVRGMPVALDLAVGRLVPGQPIGVDVRVSLAEATLKLAGTLTLEQKGPAFAGKLALNADDAAAALALAGVDLPLKAPLAVEGTVAASATAIAVDQMAVALGESRGTGSLILNLEPGLSGSLKLRLPRLDGDALLAAVAPSGSGAAPSAMPPTAPAGSVALPADLAFTLDLGVDVIQWSGGIVQKAALLATLENGRVTLSTVSAVLPGGTDVGVSGAVFAQDGRLVLDGTVDVASDNPRALADWLKVTPQGLPSDRLTRLGLTAKVKGGAAGVDLSNLVLRLDGISARGSAGWRPGPRPSASLALAVDRLNVDAYLPAAAPATPPDKNPLAEIGAGGGAPSLDPGLDVALSFTAGQLTVRGADLRRVELDGTLTGGSLRLAQLSIGDYSGLSLTASGTLGLAAGAPDANLAFKVAAPSIAPVLVLAGVDPWAGAGQMGKVTIEGTLAGRPEAPVIDAAVAVGETRLSLSGPIGAVAKPDLDLKGNLAAPELVAFARQLGADPPANGAGLGPIDLALSIKGTPAAADVAAKGKVGPASVDLSAGLKGDDLVLKGQVSGEAAAVMLTRLGLSGPLSGPLSVQVDAARKGNVIQLVTFNGGVGATRFDATGTITTGARTRVDGRLSATYLDLALFSGGGGQAGTAGGGAGSGRASSRWSTKPIDLAALRSLDGGIDIQVERLVSGSLTLAGLSGRLEAAGGRVTLANFKASMSPGDMAASVTLDGTGSTLALTVAFRGTGFDLDALTGRKGNESGLSGTGEVTLNVTGQGRSEFELVSSLKGQGGIVATAGKIHGLDLLTLSEGLKTVNQPGDILNRLAKAIKVGSTNYRRIATDLVIERGVAKLANMTSDVDGGTIGGDGTIDLPAWTTRLRLGVKLIDPADLPALGLDISGPIDNPNAEVKTRDIENYYLSKFIGSKLPGLGGGSGSNSDPGKAVLDQILKGIGGGN